VGDQVNAALISGFVVGLAGVITQNAWYYWHRWRLQVLAVALTATGTFLLVWGAGMAHRSILVVLIFALLVLAVAGSLAFVAFMAEVKHQGWIPVVKRMSSRDRSES